MFYKLKALHAKRIKITLHCFEYDRKKTVELDQYCDQVFYYPRKTGIRSALSRKPYIVSSRHSNELIDNLLQDNHPILFEGLHSCYYIDDPRLKERKKIYRESNIEHLYYYNLFKVEKRLSKKIYFLFASLKLKLYERVLKYADLMLVVSEKDTAYLQSRFRDKNVNYLPSFHPNDQIKSNVGHGDYVLYHGNLSVAENYKAANYLMEEVFNDLDLKLIIAGLNPPSHLKKATQDKPNFKLIANPSDEEMFDLIRNAHINILITFQATGLKLKLLNTLYNGRFTLVNQQMLNGTGLDQLCAIGNEPRALKREIKRLMRENYVETLNKEKERVLNISYNNQRNAEKLIQLI